ncbi:MAG: hypothetical protein ACK4MD_05135 [Demequina sp.]
MKTTVRIGAAVAAAVVAIGVYVTTAPDPDGSPSEISTARSFDAEMAESAPQQTVVNGWETNELLAYLANQQDGYAAQQNAMLLVLALIGAAMLFSLLGRRDPGTPHISPPAPAPDAQPNQAAPAAPAYVPAPQQETPRTGGPTAT